MESGRYEWQIEGHSRRAAVVVLIGQRETVAPTAQTVD